MLINCPECDKKNVSSETINCPHCGVNVKKILIQKENKEKSFIEKGYKETAKHKPLVIIIPLFFLFSMLTLPFVDNKMYGLIIGAILSLIVSILIPLIFWGKGK